MASECYSNLRGRYKLIEHNGPRDGFGPNLMPTRIGPESDLIERFLLGKPLESFSPFSTTVFCQPRLESGIPDLVAVIWDDSVTDTWSEYRSELGKNEIRLLHYIYHRRSIIKSELPSFFLRDVKRSLVKLLEANVLSQTRNRYYPRPQSEIFAVKRIIAIEAKISSWGVALSQAIMNTWFASDSYILVPKIPAKSDFTKTALKYGIRVLEESTIRFNIKPSASRLLPRSYASWLFNEWVWRERHHDRRVGA